MGFPKMMEFVPFFAVIFTLAAAIPQPPSKASDYLERRADASGASSTASAFPSCHVGTKLDCPGIYPEAGGGCNGKPVGTAIQDVSYLAHAALRALHNPNATTQLPSDPISGPINPAQHYFYFFDNNSDVASFVASVFRSIAACADGLPSCPFNIVFCNDRAWPGACANAPGRYGFVRDPNQLAAALNHNPKGGGVVFMCDAGLALPRNPTPCSTAGGADSLGFALMVELLQVDVITRPDVGFLEQHTGFDNITDFHTDGAPWTLKELGFGTNGDGLRRRGLAEAVAYAKFASLSWDYGFGGAPWTGETCIDRWEALVQSQGLVPLNG